MPVTESLDDIKQALHVGPNVFQNVLNIYQPAAERIHRRAGVAELRQSTAVLVFGGAGGIEVGR